MITQELIAIIIVLAAASWLLWRFFRKYLAQNFSLCLIRRGHLKLGFWIKKRITLGDCEECSCPSSSD